MTYNTMVYGNNEADKALLPRMRQSLSQEFADLRTAFQAVGEQASRLWNQPLDPFGLSNRITYNVADHWKNINYEVDNTRVPCIHAPPPDNTEPSFRMTIVTGLKGMTPYLRDQIRIINRLGGSVTCINFPDPGTDEDFLHHYKHIMRNIMVESPPELPEDKEDVPHILTTHSTAGMLGLLEQSRKRDAEIIAQRYNGIIHLSPMLGSAHREKPLVKWSYKAWATLFSQHHYGATLPDRLHAAIMCLTSHPDYIDNTPKKSGLTRLKMAFNAATGNSSYNSIKNNPTHGQNLYMIDRSEEIANHLLRYGFAQETGKTPTRIIYGSREFVSNPTTIQKLYETMQESIHHHINPECPQNKLIPVEDGGHFLLQHDSRTRRLIFNEIVDMLHKDAPELADKIRREGNDYLEAEQETALKSRFRDARRFLPGNSNTPD